MNFFLILKEVELSNCMSDYLLGLNSFNDKGINFHGLCQFYTGIRFTKALHLQLPFLYE